MSRFIRTMVEGTPVKLSDIAKHLHCEYPSHAGDQVITGISDIVSAQENEITFISDKKYVTGAAQSKAAAILVTKGITVEGKITIEVPNPYLAYALVAQLFEDTTPLFGEKIHSSVFIDESAKIGVNVSIAPGVVIGAHVSIGKGSVIGANTVIERGAKIGQHCTLDSSVTVRRDVQIGNRVIIQSGTVVGSEGFGNAHDGTKYVRIPCFGTVIIEDEVEIGANVTIDRGNFQPTIIKKGARIDNLIQIAHNVEIGEHTALASQVGVSGSTKIGSHCMIAGQVGFVGHIEVGDKVFVGGQAGVSCDIPSGSKITGTPARDLRKMRRVDAASNELPALLKEFKQLKKIVESLQKNDRERGMD